MSEIFWSGELCSVKLNSPEGHVRKIFLLSYMCLVVSSGLYLKRATTHPKAMCRVVSSFQYISAGCLLDGTRKVFNSPKGMWWVVWCRLHTHRYGRSCLQKRRQLPTLVCALCLFFLFGRVHRPLLSWQIHFLVAEKCGRYLESSATSPHLSRMVSWRTRLSNEKASREIRPDVRHSSKKFERSSNVLCSNISLGTIRLPSLFTSVSIPLPLFSWATTKKPKN